MGYQQGLSEYLRPHTKESPGDIPREARLRIGATKASARAVKDRRPWHLTGEDSWRVAADILQEVEEQRGPRPMKAFVEVIERGDTGAIGPSFIVLMPPAETDEDEAEELPTTMKAVAQQAGIFAPVITGMAAAAEQQSKGSTALLGFYEKQCASKDARITHLETQYMGLQTEFRQTCIAYEDKLRNANAGPPDAMAAAVQGFTDSLGRIVGPRVERWMDAAEAAAAAQANAPTPPATTEAKPADTSDTAAADVQACLDGLRLILQARPDALTAAQLQDLLALTGTTIQARTDLITEAQYQWFGVAHGKLKVLAALKGWKEAA